LEWWEEGNGLDKARKKGQEQRVVRTSAYGSRYTVLGFDRGL
jgi:hypothetical protein